MVQFYNPWQKKRFTLLKWIIFHFKTDKKYFLLFNRVDIWLLFPKSNSKCSNRELWCLLLKSVECKMAVPVPETSKQTNKQTKTIHYLSVHVSQGCWKSWKTHLFLFYIYRFIFLFQPSKTGVTWSVSLPTFALLVTDFLLHQRVKDWHNKSTEKKRW